MPGLYWEDFAVGSRWQTAARTVTESDIMGFAGLSGDYNSLHTDEEFARTTPFGRRIAHGLLGLSMLTGLTARLGIFDGTVVAFLGLKDWNFTGPIFIGDTIHAEMEIVEARPTKHPERGLIVRRLRLINQRGEVVQEGSHTLLIRRRPAAVE